MSSAARSESKTVEMSSAELLGAALAFERTDKTELAPTSAVPRPSGPGSLRLAPPRPSVPPPSASTAAPVSVPPSAAPARPSGPPPLPTSSVVSAGRNIAGGSMMPPPPSARLRPLPAPPPSRPAPASLRVPVAPPSTRAIPPPPPSHNSSLPPPSAVRRVPPPLPKREATMQLPSGPATLPAPPPPLSGPPPSASIPPTMPPTASERPRSDRPRSSRDGLRIPSPPPIPAQDVTSAAMRARHGTDHGVGSGERRPVWSDSRKNPPSLSTTQVGLGAVKLDAAGRPVLPTNTVRYLVTQGERPGQLVLNAVMPGQAIAADALVVTLAPEREADVQRLARVIAGLSA